MSMQQNNGVNEFLKILRKCAEEGISADNALYLYFRKYPAHAGFLKMSAPVLHPVIETFTDDKVLEWLKKDDNIKRFFMYLKTIIEG